MQLCSKARSCLLMPNGVLKHKTAPGQLAGEFFVGYGIVRIFGELFREPDATIMGLSRGQFYPTFMIAGGAALMVWARRRSTLENPRNERRG